jgi:hypothetical protein
MVSGETGFSKSRRSTEMNDYEFITKFIEFYHLDELISLLILYYLFKVGNIAVIFMGNLGEALMKIYRAFKEEN